MVKLSPNESNLIERIRVIKAMKACLKMNY